MSLPKFLPDISTLSGETLAMLEDPSVPDSTVLPLAKPEMIAWYKTTIFFDTYPTGNKKVMVDLCEKHWPDHDAILAEVKRNPGVFDKLVWGEIFFMRPLFDGDNAKFHELYKALAPFVDTSGMRPDTLKRFKNSIETGVY